MEISQFTVLVVLAVSSVIKGQTFDCPELQLSDLGDNSTLSSSGLLADTIRIRSGEATTPLVQILEMNVVCLAQGTARDVYRSVSVVVRYLRDSSEVTAQVEYDCVSAGVWGFASPSLTPNPNATLATSVRADCYLCLNPATAPSPAPVSAVEHCLPCAGTCTGLMRCSGEFSSQVCCNYFFMSGACTPSCNSNSQPTSTTFECECGPGYIDAANQEDCVEINECDSSPCINGGTCTDLINAFSCACVPGYTGETCMTNTDGCDSNPCENGGTCTDMINNYSCACIPGYTGETCSTNVDECDANPCENGGTCTDLVDDFSCGCSPGFGGGTCVPCEVEDCSMCPNASTCVECGDAHNLADDNQCVIIPPIDLGLVLGIVIGLLAVAVGMIIIGIIIGVVIYNKKNKVQEAAEKLELEKSKTP